MNIKEDKFQKQLLKYSKEFIGILETKNRDWSVKGFIDVKKNIYTISVDTKVISKIIELMMFPVIKRFADINKYTMKFCEEQNHYPDITFITQDKEKIALDIKSTYRNDQESVSGFTLGAYTGYFRDRKSNKNITFPYEQYKKHYILGVIYSKQDKKIDENKIYSVKDLRDILSVIKDFEFIVQEKYRIAKDRPGSGNTKNIGSCVKITELKSGGGPFAEYGVKVFNDFWMNYMTNEMAKAGGLTNPPYSNLSEYLAYRNIKNL